MHNNATAAVDPASSLLYYCMASSFAVTVTLCKLQQLAHDPAPCLPRHCTPRLLLLVCLQAFDAGRHPGAFIAQATVDVASMLQAGSLSASAPLVNSTGAYCQQCCTAQPVAAEARLLHCAYSNCRTGRRLLRAELQCREKPAGQSCSLILPSLWYSHAASLQLCSYTSKLQSFSPICHAGNRLHAHNTSSSAPAHAQPN